MGATDKLTQSEELAIDIIMYVTDYVERMRDNSYHSLSNKFACIDATIISAMYGAIMLQDLLHATEEGMAVLEELIFGVYHVFDVDIRKAGAIVKERSKYLFPVLRENLTNIPYIQSYSCLLLAHDIHHGKYVKFGRSAPKKALSYMQQYSFQKEVPDLIRHLILGVTDIIQDYVKSVLDNLF